MRPLLVIFALAVPWLNPFTLGPNAAAVQGFVTLFCALSLVFYAGSRPQLSGPGFAGVTASAWLLAASLSAGLGLLQYFGAGDWLAPLLNYAAPGEAYANLRQRNQFATLINIGLAALLWWQAAGVAALPPWLLAPRERRWLVVATVALVVVLATADAASASRTGVLQLLLLSAMTLYWQRRAAVLGPAGSGAAPALVAPWRLLLLALLVYLLMTFLLPWLAQLDGAHVGIWARLRATDSACSSRRLLWTNVLTLIAQKPWTGWGAGELAWAHFSTLYQGERFCEILDNAHNLPLHVTVLFGIPAGLLFCALLVACVAYARPWREQLPERQLAWAVLALLGLHSLLEYPLWYAPFQLALVLALLLWCSPARRQALLGSVRTHAAAGLVFVAGLYAVWDYWRISQIYLPMDSRAPAYRDDTLEKLQGSWLYRTQVRFAELSVVPLTRDNAEYMLALSKELMHYSPEPMVLEKILDSARLLGRPDDIAYYSVRFRVAYPRDYQRWAQASHLPLLP